MLVTVDSNDSLSIHLSLRLLLLLSHCPTHWLVMNVIEIFTARDLPDYIIMTEAVWQQKVEITTFQDTQAQVRKITLRLEVTVWEVSFLFTVT